MKEQLIHRKCRCVRFWIAWREVSLPWYKRCPIVGHFHNRPLVSGVGVGIWGGFGRSTFWSETLFQFIPCTKIIQLDAILFKWENVFQIATSFLPFVWSHPRRCCQLQYAYSYINIHCCSDSSILGCGIGPYNGGSCFCAAQFTHPAGYQVPESHRSPPLSRTLAAQTSVLAPYQAQATPSHLAHGSTTVHSSQCSQFTTSWTQFPHSFSLLLKSILIYPFRIILLMSAINAVRERSFSALRKVKLYLRSTRTQIRLNNIMVLHVHKDQTDQLSLIEVGNEFVQCSDHRRHLFSKFLLTD